jgi:hypothetical protein
MQIIELKIIFLEILGKGREDCRSIAPRDAKYSRNGEVAIRERGEKAVMTSFPPNQTETENVRLVSACDQQSGKRRGTKYLGKHGVR